MLLFDTYIFLSVSNEPVGYLALDVLYEAIVLLPATAVLLSAVYDNMQGRIHFDTAANMNLVSDTWSLVTPPAQVVSVPRKRWCRIFTCSCFCCVVLCCAVPRIGHAWS